MAAEEMLPKQIAHEEMLPEEMDETTISECRRLADDGWMLSLQE
jgi:hypothetical protein